MEQKKNLTSNVDENVRKFFLLQEIQHCDNMIVRSFDDPDTQIFWTEKRNDLQFELEQLSPDEL